MLRILAFFVVILAAGLGFAWLADNPGSVVIAWRGQELATSFMVFLIVAVLIVGAAILLFWLISSFFAAPDRVGRYFGRRRREKGYRALSGGILAAGAGDAQTARRLVQKSDRLLSARKEPLIKFLDAQTAMIEGDHARARRVFESMEKEPSTRLLALRGLFLEAERVNDTSAARHYAEQAVRIAPQVPWAGNAILELKAAESDYDGALEILAAQRHSRLVDRDESHRLRAVLLTAKAMKLANADPSGSQAAAREAQKLAPDLTPAALTAARASIRLGDHRKATKVLETSWKDDPHTDVGELYLRVRPGDGASERLKRARRLQTLRPDHVESDLVVARAALDARDFALARREAEAAAAKAPRESVYLLLADIEEAEGGDQGRIRAYISRAIHAQKDPSWTADGVVSQDWMPISPVTGRLDSFRWKAPMERRAGPMPVMNEPLADEAELVEVEPSPSWTGQDAASGSGSSTEIVRFNAANGAADPVSRDQRFGESGVQPTPIDPERSDERKQARFGA